MSINVTSADFDIILADLGVTVSYKAVTNVIDPITGDNTPTYADAVNKTWIFYKRSNKELVNKWGIVDNADAYVFVPKTDTLNVGDQIVYGGETFEITDAGKRVDRYMGINQMYKYYGVFKVD